VSTRAQFNYVGEGSSVPKPYSPPPHPLLRREKPLHSGEEFRPLHCALRSAVTSPPFSGRGGPNRRRRLADSSTSFALGGGAHKRAARRLTRNGACNWDGEVPSGSSCSSSLPRLVPCGDNDDNDEDAPALPLTCGSSTEAALVEVAAVVA
jgi:hypothetical protein